MSEEVQTFDPGESSLWELRPQEQPYARLNDPDHAEVNRYGQKIDLLDLTGHQAPANRSMHINENPEVGCNPNRNKQHGFFFTADNCIGCHACEAACAEKNETPAHLAFRSVGYVEGGSYPDYQRLNISMACNHCDDPVCLTGCPTAAYTKHAEYGAVLQDPDTCFGCGYCTWVCPYNAPQLDPIEGQVSKCNMCVDRLEVGLKPACVSACLGNALDFGVIENIPENREEASVSIPGFPDPDITHPNIRFQQTKRLPEVMTRTDSNPLKYQQTEAGYKPMPDDKQGRQRAWNLRALSSKENVLVAFTLCAQAGIGLFTASFVAGSMGFITTSGWPAFVSCGFVAIALFMSTVHLGKPLRFYRGFNNLKYSPVSREAAGIAAFLGCASLSWLSGACNFGEFAVFTTMSNIFAVLAISGGAVGLYYMVKCYRIPARPFWNHWQVATAFTGTTLSLGGLLGLGFMALSSSLSAVAFFGSMVCVGLSAEAIGLYWHAKDLRQQGGEGAAAQYLQTTKFGKTYYLRNGLLAGNVGLSASLLGMGTGIGIGWLVVGVLLVSTALIGRSLFYVLVIPTTMPGAFFWKNPGFEAHARDVGLAAMPQVGVVQRTH